MRENWGQYSVDVAPTPAQRGFVLFLFPSLSPSVPFTFRVYLSRSLAVLPPVVGHAATAEAEAVKQPPLFIFLITFNFVETT